MTGYQIQPFHQSFDEELCVPGDKSISHRSIMLAAIAEGTSHIQGFLPGEDNLATLKAFQQMGVDIITHSPTHITVHGVGKFGLTPSKEPFDMGNSGTAMRLMAGLLCPQSFNSELVGDHSLSQRPMARIVKPLTSMGAIIETLGKAGRPPIKITGTPSLKGFHYSMPVASAQVKSSLLLAGLYGEGKTKVTEPAPTRDHTERMLQAFQCPISLEGSTVILQGGATLQATDIQIPGDISSAAFFMVAASIVPGARLLLKNIGVNPTRIGVINILQAMGAQITLTNERYFGFEPVADIEVRQSPLHGISIPQDQVPLAIDEFPVLFIAAACAQGQTRLTGAEELRVKESDRIESMVNGLQILGIQAQGTADGAIIEGGVISGGRVQSVDDHRIAMAFAIASLVAKAPIEIQDCENVSTSFPSFVQLMSFLGQPITIKED